MPGEMSSEKEKTLLVPLPDGSKMIELTIEELREYTECMEGKRLTNQLVSVTAGIVTAMALKVKATTPAQYYLKKGLAATFAMSCFSIFTALGSALRCGPILQKILKAKTDTSPGFVAPDDEKDEPSTKELLDFTPSISSHDFSSPINFSSDTSSGDRVFDKLEDSQDLGDKTASGKKRVTYDDLWRRHQENSQARNKPSYSSEGTDLGTSAENEPSWEKKKIRTNKYGDPLE